MESNGIVNVRFDSGKNVPLELHKVRMVQKLHLKPIEERLKAIAEGGYNTFLLKTTDLFLDMLTDSGTNAMSDNQVSSMLQADDAYAGSQSFYRMEAAIQRVFGTKYLLPVHQGERPKTLFPKRLSKKEM
jgi:tyrosine phenol-lyase